MECLLCGTESLPLEAPIDRITYYQCPRCLLRFKAPTCYQTLQEQKSRYDLHNNSAEDPGYRAYFQRFLDFLLPHLDEGVVEALDFGCGRSQLLATMLSEEGIICDAYDPLYHPETSYQSKRYDLIVSTEVFEHLLEPQETFIHLLQHLKRGGYVAIQTQFYPEGLDAFTTWYYHKDPTHILFYRPETFKVLATLHGCHYLADNGKNMVVLRREKGAESH